MRSIFKLVHFLAWPFWLIYFRLVPNRSRVLIMVGDEFLLVSGWISAGDLNLPGGGSKRTESVEESAVRELKEEVGIKVSADSLRPLGVHYHRKHGINYNAHTFLIKLDTKPAVTKQKKEIAEALWVKEEDLSNKNISQDVIFALKKYHSNNLV